MVPWANNATMDCSRLGSDMMHISPDPGVIT